jgi:ribosome-binding factor A
LCMHGLRHSAGFVHAKLAARLKTRYTPTIRFIVDEGVKKSIEVTRLINEALAQSRPETEAQSADGTVDEDAEEG